jgi:hypothetical protein
MAHLIFFLYHKADLVYIPLWNLPPTAVTRGKIWNSTLFACRRDTSAFLDPQRFLFSLSVEETPMSTITIDKSRPFLHEYGLENFGLHISKSSSIGNLFIIVK